MSSWKRDAASGLVVVAPLLVSAYVVAWFYWQLAKVPILRPPDGTDPTWYQTDPVRVVVFLAVFALVVLSVGYLMRTTIGTIVERRIDEAANRLPIVRVVYNASKMAAETALTGTENLQGPVKLEAWDGMRMTAFQTGKTTDDGRDVLFLPTAPNITTGFVVEVEPEDYVETDERVEDALTRILSAGFGESRERGLPIDELGTASEETPAADGGDDHSSEETPAADGGDDGPAGE